MNPTIAINGNPGIPKHEQLREFLLGELSSGRLKPGDALPTEQKLTVEGRMSRNTVRQALAELERQGLIRRVAGRGTFVHESAMVRLKSGLDLFALVIPETQVGFYPSLQRGFHEAAAAISNQVVVCDTNNDPSRQAMAVLQLIDKEVAGVAIVPTSGIDTPRYQIRPLQMRGIPVVFCHRRVEGIQAPLVTFSAVDVGRMAAATLLRHGHRHIAFFSHVRGGLAPLYLQGFREVLREASAELPEHCVCFDDSLRFTPEHAEVVRRSLRQLLNAKPRPTAIYCTFDAEAEVVYLELMALGIQVPDEIALVGFGARAREGALLQRLVSVTVDEEALGRRVVNLLDEMRQKTRPMDDTTEIVMPLELSGGDTLASLRR